METKDDAQRFINKFGQFINKFDGSNWIIDNKMNKGNNCRFIMHKNWLCNYSSHRKNTTKLHC